MSVVQLKIKKSVIGKGGRARIAEPSFEEIGVEEGDLVVIESDDRTVLVEAYSDIIVEDGYIRVRYTDMERLEVLEEDTISVYPYKPISKKIKKRSKRVIG